VLYSGSSGWPSSEEEQNSLDKEGAGHYILWCRSGWPLNSGPPPQIVPTSLEEGITCQPRRSPPRRSANCSLFSLFSGPLLRSGPCCFYLPSSPHGHSERSESHFATTSSGMLCVSAELAPTMMSKTPGSTTRRISRSTIESISDVSLNSTVCFSPGFRLMR